MDGFIPTGACAPDLWVMWYTHACGQPFPCLHTVAQWRIQGGGGGGGLRGLKTPPSARPAMNKLTYE